MKDSEINEKSMDHWKNKKHCLIPTKQYLDIYVESNDSLYDSHLCTYSCRLPLIVFASLISTALCSTRVVLKSAI